MLEEVHDWPGMRFQLACTYARVILSSHLVTLCFSQVDIMHESVYDNARLRVYEQQYQDHPLYRFWLHYLRLGSKAESLFVTSNS